MSSPRYIARSASDRTADWPFWFVADEQRGGLNVTANILRSLGINPRGAVLAARIEAEAFAEVANAVGLKSEDWL